MIFVATFHQQMAQLQVQQFYNSWNMQESFEVRRSKLQLCFSFNSFYQGFHVDKASSGRLNKTYYYVFSRAILSPFFFSLWIPYSPVTDKMNNEHYMKWLLISRIQIVSMCKAQCLKSANGQPKKNGILAREQEQHKLRWCTLLLCAPARIILDGARKGSLYSTEGLIVCISTVAKGSVQT